MTEIATQLRGKPTAATAEVYLFGLRRSQARVNGRSAETARAAHEQEIVEDDVCRATVQLGSLARRGLDEQGPDDLEPFGKPGPLENSCGILHICTHGDPRLANLFVKQAGDRVHAHFKVAAGGFRRSFRVALGP